jgi:hypothetical protein
MACTNKWREGGFVIFSSLPNFLSISTIRNFGFIYLEIIIPLKPSSVGVGWSSLFATSDEDLNYRSSVKDIRSGWRRGLCETTL